MTWKDEVVMYMDEKRYAVLLTETQDVKVIACNLDKDMFDIGTAGRALYYDAWHLHSN